MEISCSPDQLVTNALDSCLYLKTYDRVSGAEFRGQRASLTQALCFGNSGQPDYSVGY